MPLVKMPTGEVVDMPDNPTPDQVAQLQLMHSPSGLAASPDGSPDTPAAQMMRGIVGPGIARQLGLTLRSIGGGAASTIGMGADALQYLGQKAGLPVAEKPSAMIERKMTESGLPVPQSGMEKVNNFGYRMLGGMADPLAAGIVQSVKAPAPLYQAPPQIPVKTQMLQKAQQEGYAAPPSIVGGNFTGKVLESVGGKSTTAKLMNQNNQNMTDAIARKAAGLTPDSPLTHDALQTAIQDTVDQGYTPISKLGPLPTTPQYHQALDQAMEQYQGMSNSFPAAAKPEVEQLINSYRVPSFDAKDAIRATQQLRSDASAAFNSGNSALGHAHRAVSNALENNIEQVLSQRDADLMKQGILEADPAAMANGVMQPRQSGQQLVDQFRAARQQLAKQYAVKDALVPDSGSIDAAKLAAQLRQGSPLTGGLRTAAGFANTFPQLATRPKDVQPLLTPMEKGMLGYGGMAAAHGNLATGLPSVAYPLASAGSRRLLASQLGQQLFAQPAMPAVPFGLSNPYLLNAVPAAVGQVQNGLFGSQ